MVSQTTINGIGSIYLIIPPQHPPSLPAFNHRTVLFQKGALRIKAAILITNIGTVEPKLTLFSVQCPATKALGAFSPHAPRHLFVALQLLLRMPPASPFTASPFDLVINPGQRANGPVRLGYTPPSGARDCDRKINGEP